jgi:hypothetical protein
VRDLSKHSLTRDLPFSPFLYLFLPIGVNDFFLDLFVVVESSPKSSPKGRCSPQKGGIRRKSATYVRAMTCGGKVD